MYPSLINRGVRSFGSRGELFLTVKQKLFCNFSVEISLLDGRKVHCYEQGNWVT